MEPTKSAVCERCSANIYLIQTGQFSWKWVTDPDKGRSWRCGNDPAFPVLGHTPVEAS